MVDDHFFPEHFEVTAGAAFVFDEEDGAGLDGVGDIGGEGGEGLLVEEGRDEKDGGGGMLYVLHGAKLGNLKYPGGSGIGAGMSFFLFLNLSMQIQIRGERHLRARFEIIPNSDGISLSSRR